jgi:hypothetical protein
VWCEREWWGGLRCMEDGVKVQVCGCERLAGRVVASVVRGRVWLV